MNQIDDLIARFPNPYQAWLRAARSALNRATELRFRAGRRMTAVCGAYTIFIGEQGASFEPQLTPVIEQQALSGIVSALCEYSVYSHSESLRDGYLTIDGGHRIGVCAGINRQGVVDMGAISSVNIRVANERLGCARALAETAGGDAACSVLLCGAPMSGKTTILRDYTRILSDSPAYIRCAVLDERGELAAMRHGQSPFRLGECTDVVEGMDRRRAFGFALRTLSPQVIVCDELAGEAELSALFDCAKSGVRIIASAHASNLSELRSRAGIWRAVEAGIFEWVAFLSGPPEIGKLMKCYRVVL